jgi:hypothetical protein
VYINLGDNPLTSIHPGFFDGLSKLKLVNFNFGNDCVTSKIGCETCLVEQEDIKEKLQKCFENFKN